MSIGRSRWAVAALSGATLLAVCAAPAGAAVRNTSPTATATSGDCGAIACRIDFAVGGASAGDEIVVAPGTYKITAPVAAKAPVHIHAPARLPRPVLQGDTSLSGPTLELPAGGTVADLRIETNAVDGNGLVIDGGTADGIYAVAGPNALRANAVRARGSAVLRNSVAWTRRSSTDAVETADGRSGGAPTVIGVTAVAATNATAFFARGTERALIKNSVATGTAAIGILSGSGTSGSGGAGPRVSRTLLSGSIASGTVSLEQPQRSAGPSFVGAPNGNFREAAGSPTIDAGERDLLSGDFDADGAARVLGAAPDIGAYEYDPVKPSTGSGSGGSGDGGKGGDETPSTDPGTGSGDTGSGPTAPATPLPPAAEPVLGATVTLGDVKGNPRVRLPGSTGFVPLAASSTVPVGAVVDVTAGTVDLTSVRDKSGKTQTGRFWGGVFKVGQAKKDGVTELTLASGDFSSCRVKGSVRGKVTAAGRKTVRRLWGRDRGGRFRTRGRNGSATVRGTRWLTEDRCDGTYFKVTQGAIDVRDDRKRKTVRLKRGGSYLAAAAAKRKRPKG